MKNLKFSRLFAAVMVVACLMLVGCKQPTDDNGSQPAAVVSLEDVRVLTSEDGIVGKWADDYEPWNTYGDYDCGIALDYIETASYGRHEGSVYLAKTSETSGYIYYQFSEDIIGYDAEYNSIIIEGTKNKWCAVAYKNLTADSVQMCDAYKTYDFADSLSAAVELYTVDNDWFGGINTTFTKVTLEADNAVN